MTGDLCRQDYGSDSRAMGERWHLTIRWIFLDLSLVKMP